MSTKRYLIIIFLVLLATSLFAYLVTKKVGNRASMFNTFIDQVNNVLKTHNPILSKVEQDVLKSQGRINLIENPTDEHVFEILKQYSNSYVRRDDPFNKNGNIHTKAFTYIKNPNDEQKLRAIGYNPHVLEYIPEPTEEMMLKAVSKDGNAIQWIENPTVAVMLAAVKQKPSSVRYIRIRPPEEVMLAAATAEGKSLDKIREPSEAVIIAAIDSDLEAFKDVENPSETVLAEKKFVEQILADSKYVQSLTNPTEEELLHIISIDPLSIRFIKNPSEALQLAALKEDWTLGKVIENLTSKANELYESNKNEANINYEECVNQKTLEYKNAEKVPGELLVSFVPNTREIDQTDLISGLGLEIKERFKSINGFILTHIRDLPIAVCELKKNPLIKDVSPNFIAHIAS